MRSVATTKASPGSTPATSARNTARALTTTRELSGRIRFVERLVREVGAADDSMFVCAVLGIERHVEASLDKFAADRHAIFGALRRATGTAVRDDSIDRTPGRDPEQSASNGSLVIRVGCGRPGDLFRAPSGRSRVHADRHG